MGTDKYASTPKLIIDQDQKPFLDFDETLVEYVDYDNNGSDYTSQDLADDNSGSLTGGDASPPPDPGNPPPTTGNPGGGGGTGPGGAPPPLLDIPILVDGSLTQTSRVLDDGTTVIDVTFEVTDVVGAVKYEVRITPQ